jgi:hypothetical protein
MKLTPNRGVRVASAWALLAANAWLATAAAQAAGLTPGSIPQPSPASPGLVAGVTFGELYTDNLWLAYPGKPRASAWVTEVQPFIKAAASQPRFNGVFDYTLAGYWYAGQSQHHQVSQSLDARATLTVVPDHLFVYGTGMYGRVVVDDRLPSGPGTLFLNENQLNVGIATLSPYWMQDLGNAGTLTLRYTRGRVVYNDHGIPAEGAGLLQGIPNVTSDTAQFSLVSPGYQTLGWNLAYSNQRLDPDNQPGVRFSMAKLEVSSGLTDHLRALVDVGKESRFSPDGSVQQLGSPFWDAGFTWMTARNDFKLTLGHRFYGRSYTLAWTHQAALLTTSVTYTEQPTTYNQQLLALQSGIDTPLPIDYGNRIPSLANQRPYLSKRWTAAAAYSMPLSTLRVQVYDETRTYFVQDADNERVADAGISWALDLGARSTLTPSFDWQRHAYEDGQVTFHRYAQVALVQQFNRKNFGSVRLRHDDSRAGAVAAGAYGYHVNVIFLMWTHLL